MMMASEAETEAVSEFDDCAKDKAEYLATVQRLLNIHNLDRDQVLCMTLLERAELRTQRSAMSKPKQKCVKLTCLALKKNQGSTSHIAQQGLGEPSYSCQA